MQIIDWIVLAICFGMAWPMPGLAEPLFSLIEKKFSQFARHKWASLAAIGSATIITRLALLPWMPVPQPKIHDEFSYLLAGDTFARGRLVNLPHPMWFFLDTFHVIQHPSYASMYPPAQGTMLAIGQLLGNPWIGVLLSTAAMCVAMTWMFQGWMPPEWALVGGVLVFLRLGLFSYWMNSYWGGAVAATGAAMVLGALPRILKFRRSRDAAVFGLGAAILAISRPVEGFIFCLPLTAGFLLWILRRQNPAQAAPLRRVFAPIAVILLCIVGFVGYYNSRVTGSPIVFPHFIEQRMYFTTPVFLWDHDQPRRTYANPQFDDFYNNYMPSLYQPGWDQAVGHFWWKATEFWQFFLGPALSIPFLALPWLLGDRKIRLLLLQAALSAIGLWVVVFYHAHYAAPLAATTFLLLMLGMRRMRGWRFRGHAIGIALTRMIVLFSLLIGPVYFVHAMMSKSNSHFDFFHRHYLIVLAATLCALTIFRLVSTRIMPAAGRSLAISFCEFAFLVLVLLQICVLEANLHPDDYPIVEDLAEPFRRPVEQQLAALPGSHLVLVRYAKDHNSGEEYVYNGADIDHAKTVWAREIPGVDVTPLLSYFRNRDVWLFEPDEGNGAVSRYSPLNSSP
ncbi:MAG: hypothetical protein JWN92_1065 [Candidatus Acidoferrum typicum]|nr:hypothetical protein [Candidatus Acidoferrum typicum]